MAFDPMTGEPIENGDDEEMAFDPMTGEPIRKQPAPAPVQAAGSLDLMTEKPSEQPQQPVTAPVQEAGGFDPMTGKPLGQPQQPVTAPTQETGGFDPMTGKPLGQPQQPVTAPTQGAGGFDPMTGKPLGQQQQSAPVQGAGSFDPMTGRPIQNSAPNGKNQNRPNKNGKKVLLPVLIGVIAAAMVAIVVTVVISSGLLLGKAGKVTMAMANTFKDKPHFMTAFEDTANILSQNKYTIALSGDVDDVKFDGELRNGGSEKQLSMQLSQGKSKLEFIFGIDSKNAKFQVPQLSNYLFVYDYKKTSTGYLADELGDDTIEQLNTILESLVKQTDTKNVYADLFKICKDELKNVSFVNADKEEFTINEKDVSCKGYTAVITSSNMIHMVDKLEKLINDEYASLAETALTVDMSGEDWEEVSAEAFDEIRDELESMDDIELSFYLYKNKLAGIILDVPDEDVTVELSFEGGDYRMQNMTLRSGDERYRLSGSDDGSEESFELEYRSGSYRQQIGSLEYNYDSGKYTVALAGEMTVSGKLTCFGSKADLKIDKIDFGYYSMAPDLSIHIQKGAKMEKFTGKEFDLGKADEDDYIDLQEDIQDKMYDKDLDWITYLF